MSSSPRHGELTAQVAEPGFTPSIRQLTALLDLVAGEDEDIARSASRAILRIDANDPARVTDEAIARAAAAIRPARGRLAALVGRLAQESRDPRGSARAWLEVALDDSDAKTRRAAARALGKLTPSPALEAALAGAFDRAPSEDDRKVLAEALGRMGGDAARERLAGGEHVRASLIADREAARRSPGAIDPAADLGHPARVWFHTRSGLEGILEDELAGRFGGVHLAAPGIVEATLEGPLSRALAIRTATHVGFPLARRTEGDVADAIAHQLTTPEAESILRAFTKTEGGARIRFRLSFVLKDPPRAVLWKCAGLVRERSQLLVNDPRGSTWDVVVAAGGRIELVPRAADERFGYRHALVPASSHPVIAAALARVADGGPDDVVWDPFAGAGTELVERALRGPARRLLGTDRDPRAVAAARENVARAGVTVEIQEGDACTFRPALGLAVTVIVTNPPMGRRVERGGHGELLEAFVDHAAAVLPPGGVLVWLVPSPGRIRPRAEAAGFVIERATAVDMGGFSAELSVYRKAATKPGRKTSQKTSRSRDSRRETLSRRPR